MVKTPADKWKDAIIKYRKQCSENFRNIEQYPICWNCKCIWSNVNWDDQTKS